MIDRIVTRVDRTTKTLYWRDSQGLEHGRNVEEEANVVLIHGTGYQTKGGDR